mmetsp:Transcript_19137/g.27799  ORF Transcript_19137/g.27799 Transcript_19137/m.27799 type:complete len:235 (+) Transcript_19137:2262-2966(+)
MWWVCILGITECNLNNHTATILTPDKVDTSWNDNGGEGSIVNPDDIHATESGWLIESPYKGGCAYSYPGTGCNEMKKLYLEIYNVNRGSGSSFTLRELYENAGDVRLEMKNLNGSTAPYMHIFLSETVTGIQVRLIGRYTYYSFDSTERIATIGYDAFTCSQGTITSLNLSNMSVSADERDDSLPVVQVFQADHTLGVFFKLRQNRTKDTDIAHIVHFDRFPSEHAAEIFRRYP